jgi:hypothetical protein
LRLKQQTDSSYCKINQVDENQPPQPLDHRTLPDDSIDCHRSTTHGSQNIHQIKQTEKHAGNSFAIKAINQAMPVFYLIDLILESIDE